MGDQQLLELGRQAVTVMFLAAGPALVAATVVGLVISIFQAVTQINEMTLTFVPKIIVVFAVLGVMGPWIGDTLLSYTLRLFTELPSLAH